jgi:RNA polymerase sigma-70 factor (ECF subfamily)
MDFDEFFTSSRAEMVARALMLSGSRHDAEDAVQEAYTAAWSQWDRISGYDSPGAWVYKVVRQRLWKSAKRWRRVSSVGVDDLAQLRSAEGDPQRFVEAVAALAAMAQLPHRQRMVLVMHCLQQMEQQQIADELGLSRGAVAASIFKARRKLEKALGMKDTGLATLDGRGPSVVGTDARAQDPLNVVLRAVVSYLTAAQPAAGSVVRPGKRR